MSTMMGNTRRVLFFLAAGAMMAVFATHAARADVASDRPGAVLIFPKIVVDTGGVFGPPTDTEIQLTNTSNHVIGVRCFMVDATSHCSNNPSKACTAANEATPDTAPCSVNGGVCLADTCSANDFRMTLTKRQPIAWKVSKGQDAFPCEIEPCANNGSNAGSTFPVVQEDPFFGELKCVEVDPTTFAPIIGEDAVNNNAGDLKGEATIVSRGENGVGGTGVDARKYNAIAFEATAAAGTGSDPDTLILGGPDAQYNGGPNLILLDHFYDNANVTTHKGQIPSSNVTTDLTLVPVTENLADPNVNDHKAITLQFLTFNEFEQRFSTSTNFSCWRELQISDIDTRIGNSLGNNAQSIFNVGVEGTLTGQTRIRSVTGTDTANTVVGLKEEFWTSPAGPAGRFTDAANVHFAGTRDQSDQITLHPDTVP